MSNAKSKPASKEMMRRFEICGACGEPWNAGLHICAGLPKRVYFKSWTFRRVWRIWGLIAALRFWMALRFLDYCELIEEEYNYPNTQAFEAKPKDIPLATLDVMEHNGRHTE